MIPDQVRRLLSKLAADGDRAVVHRLRGRPSNRKLDKDKGQRIVMGLSEERYRDYGPTLAPGFRLIRRRPRGGWSAVFRPTKTGW